MSPITRSTEAIDPPNIDDHPMPLPHADPDPQYPDSVIFVARAFEITCTPYSINSLHKYPPCNMAFLTATGLWEPLLKCVIKACSMVKVL